MAMTVDERDAVTLSLEGPRPQRRLTVAFRVILAIPHFLFFAVLAIAATIVVFFAWFGALFLGRMPEGFGDFIEEVVQYQARLSAYMYLLTDEYPRFSLSADDYPVELEIRQPDRLNRWAVLFRFLLVIPAWFISTIVSGGATVVLFFLWIITLVSGRMPDSAFQALAVTMRYQQRAYAYTWMLTSQYPGGLFGDQAEPAADALAVDALPPVGQPLAGPPRITRLVLTTAAKRLVVLFIVLGVLTNGASYRRTFDLSNREDTAAELRSEHSQLEKAIAAFLVDAQTCAASGDSACIRAANAQLVLALRDFQRDVADIDIPARADDERAAVDADTTQMIVIINQMQEASELSSYQELASELSVVGTRFDQDYQQLYDEVVFG